MASTTLYFALYCAALELDDAALLLLVGADLEDSEREGALPFIAERDEKERDASLLLLAGADFEDSEREGALPGFAAERDENE